MIEEELQRVEVTNDDLVKSQDAQVHHFLP
jgi:hypothetical protein